MSIRVSRGTAEIGGFEELRGCLVPAIETKQIGIREQVERIGESCSELRWFVSLVSLLYKNN